MREVMEITIDKSQRGWSVQYIVRREGWPDSVTNAGAPTLASALWHTIDAHRPQCEIASVTVKGRPMSRERVYQIIEKSLKGGPLAYSLPSYAKILQVSG